MNCRTAFSQVSYLLNHLGKFKLRVNVQKDVFQKKKFCWKFEVSQEFFFREWEPAKHLNALKISVIKDCCFKFFNY